MANERGPQVIRRPGRRRRLTFQFSALITAVALVSSGCGNRADTGVAAQAQAGADSGQTAVEGTIPNASDGTAVTDTGAVAAVPGAATGPAAAATAAALPGQQTTTGGSAKSGGAGSAGTGAGGKAQSATMGDCSKPIIIGSVGEYSGVLGAIEKPATIMIAAWAASLNSTGGLYCHQVKYVIYDQGGDPSRNQALVRRAVEQDKVIAFVYNGAALAGQSTVAYIQQEQIPVIGEEGGNAWSCVNSMFFPVMSTCGDGVEGVYQVLAKHANAPDKKVAAFSCVEVPFCSAFNDLAESSAKKAGLEFVYNGGISLTQPDYTSSCLLAQRAGASMVVMTSDSSATSRFVDSCASVNYKPIIASAGTAFTPAAAAASQLQGAWLAAGVKVAPLTDPAVAAALAVQQKFAPGSPITPNMMIGWVSAQVFTEALKGLTTNPTSQDVLNGMWKIKNFTANGLARSLTYKKGSGYNPSPKCWFPVQVKNKAFVGSPQLCA